MVWQPGLSQWVVCLEDSFRTEAGWGPCPPPQYSVSGLWRWIPPLFGLTHPGMAERLESPDTAEAEPRFPHPRGP